MIRTLRSWLAGATVTAPPRSDNRKNRGVKLDLQTLESRDVPALFSVHLGNPGSGSGGDTAASISGSLMANYSLPTDSSGRTLVEAASAQQAVSLALIGTVTAQFNGETLAYTMGSGMVGAAAS